MKSHSGEDHETIYTYMCVYIDILCVDINTIIMIFDVNR